MIIPPGASRPKAQMVTPYSGIGDMVVVTPQVCLVHMEFRTAHTGSSRGHLGGWAGLPGLLTQEDSGQMDRPYKPSGSGGELRICFHRKKKE